MENLTEDDLDRMRERRLDALKKQQRKRQEWMRRGHGEYREVDEKDFFNEMKKTDRMVCHFFRNSWPCQVMDKHLGILAAKHVETKFVRVNAEKAPFLTDRLKIWMLPTLVSPRNASFRTREHRLGTARSPPPTSQPQKRVLTWPLALSFLCARVLVVTKRL